MTSVTILPPWIHQVCWRAASILPTIPMTCPATDQQTEGASSGCKSAWENRAVLLLKHAAFSFSRLGHRACVGQGEQWRLERRLPGPPSHWVLEIVPTYPLTQHLTHPHFCELLKYMLRTHIKIVSVQNVLND